MAKQVVGPLERHVEKAVLAVAALLLVGVVVRFLISSPNQTDIGGTMVSPGAVDAVLFAKANDVRDRVRSARPAVSIPEPLADEFETLVDPFSPDGLGARLTLAAPLGPEVPIIDPPEVILGGARLAKVVTPPKPAFTKGRSWFQVEREGGGPPYEYGRNWVTVSFVFDRERQEELQAEAYGNTRREVVFGPIEMQRRAQRPDGSWSDADWEMVDPEPDPAQRIRPAPPIPIEEERGQLVVPISEHNNLIGWFNDLSEPQLQIELLRPILYNIISGDDWVFPRLVSRNDLLRQDDEYLSPGEPSPDPVDRYGLEPAREIAATETSAAQEQSVAQRLKDVENAIARARTPGECIDLYNDAFDLTKAPGASPAEKQRAQELMALAEQRQFDLERERRRQGPGGGADPGDDDAPARREYSPVQQVWVIDSADGAVESGTTYQYRVRVNITNRLAGEPAKFDDPSLAQQVYVTGDWSEPTDPVEIQPTDYFYFTNFDDRRGNASFEIFAWFEGYWQKERSRFKVGDRLWTEARGQVPSREDPSKAERPLVRFDGRGVLIDVDGSRLHRDRTRGTERDGVAYVPGTTTPVAIVAGEDGRLRMRFVSTDKASPEKNRVNAMVWQPPAP